MNKPASSPQPVAQEDRQSQISEYLQAPRRKRKNFVVLALGKGFPPNIRRTIEALIASSFPNLATVNPENMEELKRLFGRNISLLVINDDLAELDEIMVRIKQLKQKRHPEKIPVLFMTRNSKKLIASYHEHLLEYQELDDYVQYEKASQQLIVSRVKDGLDVESHRRSKRFPVKLPISFFHLTKDQHFDATIVDLSVHGAKIVANNCLFQDGEQLLLRIPIDDRGSIHDGDFLKLSARVRRVHISGNYIGISFEHISERQSEKLSRLVVKIASQNMRTQKARLKAHYDSQLKTDM